MFSRIERLLFAVMIALLFAGITLVIAQARTAAAPQAQTPVESCGICHPSFQEEWMNGPHGTATTDPIFKDAWTAQGKPGACLVCHTTGYDPATATWQSDGIACQACHNPIPSNHPNDPMPIDKTPELCASCHSDSRFGWGEWEGSTHYQRNMTCTVCHDVHSASLKITQDMLDQSGYQDASALCVNCHREYAMNFPYTSHHNQGLTCVDCHLRHLEGSDQTHNVPDHSFNASLASCSLCHQKQMHGPTEQTGSGTTAPATTPDASSNAGDIQMAAVTPEPTPVSPVGFAGLAALIGLAVGMVMSPWLERLYHKANKSAEDSND